MGCDIHAGIEYRDRDHWEVFAREVELPRSYRVFSALAGVRNYHEESIEPISEPRGLPDDLSWWMKPDEDGHWLGDHSFSWVTTAEFEEALKRSDEGRAEYRAVLAAMKVLEAEGWTARLVFGFDN